MTTDESVWSLTPYIRVLKLAAEPTKEEFKQVSLVVGAGALIIGALGMAIYGISTLGESVLFVGVLALILASFFIPRN